MTAPVQFELCPVAAGDSEFICRLVLETMRDYIVATWGVCDETRIRDESAEASASNASIILVCGQRAGLITVAHHNTHIQLEQLYLLPQFQNRSIGESLMQNLLAESTASQRPIRLQVLQVNPARRFYERLGFVTTSETKERVQMEHPL